MPKMKVADISTDKRFREEFGELEELAESIRKHGLIHPPVVSEDGLLIAGERRFKACQLLNLEEIEVRKLSDLTELERKEIELEENLRRKQFTWAESVKAKKQLHLIKQIQEGERVKGHDSDGWGTKDTAKALDQSLGTVSQDIQLATALEEFPELAKCKNKSAAWKKYKKKEEEETLKKMADLVGNQQISDLYQLYNEDFLIWAEEQPDESFDLVLADPPWGIDMDSKSRMSRERDLEYDDSLDYALDLIDRAAVEFYRLLKEDTHLYVYFGIAHKNLFEEILQDAGFEVCTIPIIYNKARGGSAAKGKTYPNAYETIFHCWKGSRKLNTTHHNVFTEKRPEGKKRIHSAQKPVAMNENLIQASSDPGEKVLVPFMGSGSAVVAAIVNDREAIGVEKKVTTYANAVEWIQTRLADEEV